ncbi:hypothetical protein [Alteribacter populi]|uniref:hypothetical protein n=1 Tax=Alteribacter populi TaxID=2011011 RepID=UPI000BBB02CC|nr:hypothetical protein [Alteribacter populi]
MATHTEQLKTEISVIERKVREGGMCFEERSAEIDRVSKEYVLRLSSFNDAQKAAEELSAESSGRKPRELPINPPDTALLDRLSDLLLHEDLTDKTPWKIRNTEYPFMNARMTEDRKAKDVKVSAIEREQERKLGGTRRMRAPQEHAFMDRAARNKNAERRRKYNAFVKGKTEGVLRVVIKKAE